MRQQRCFQKGMMMMLLGSLATANLSGSFVKTPGAAALFCCCVMLLACVCVVDDGN